MSVEVQTLPFRNLDKNNRIAAEAVASMLVKPIALPLDTISSYADENKNALEFTGVAPVRVQQSILGAQPKLAPPLVTPSDVELDRDAFARIEASRNDRAELYKLDVENIRHERKAIKDLHVDLDHVKEEIESGSKWRDIANKVKQVFMGIAACLGLITIGLTAATAGISSILMILPAVASLMAATAGVVEKIFEIEMDKKMGKARESKELISLCQKKISQFFDGLHDVMNQAQDLWKMNFELIKNRIFKFS